MLYLPAAAARRRAPYLGVLNVTRYITFRTAAASLTALAISLLLGPWMIRKLRDFQIGQVIRQEGPQSHRAKAGTPTMGGLLILRRRSSRRCCGRICRTRTSGSRCWRRSGFGAVGFIDDYLKIVAPVAPRADPALQDGRADPRRARRRRRGADAAREQNPPLYNTRLIFPFFKNLIPDLGWFYVLFAVLVLVVASNAVNLTDGLDGLAISTFGVAAAAFTALAYVTGHAVLADYLLLVRFPPAGELTIFCGALVGASLGFLWYNCYPAEIFMGDVGSLALGGALGTVAILIKQELLLPIVGGVFVIEGCR